MNTKQDNIIRTDYAEIMQKSYIDYAMSVIISRALPDVRDGLKPVQRRTLYDMYELGIRYDRPYRKCGNIPYPHCRLAGCSKRKLSRNKTYCGNYIKFEPARQVDIKLNNLVRIIMRL